ncbi:4'-phosphopantetheinyl transferase superfamily protein [Arthrobacter sp. OV608]|uniref:4'-phosphopantetheinyl transferase family protein n=1 Tax=Arthrobacter sp. OV608 TaxID=1882768 RepID=UPI0008D33326|nr:4'-phosphopantetheinyl transferase superfamily protein [Arthrobacter sp. OV608]SEP88056.1 Phosphopantetheinyl transferase [Arthrobacter sp. OV608]
MTPAAAPQGLSLAAVRLSGVDLGLEHVLDDDEVARAGMFRSQALRDRFVAGRIALRLHIGALTGDSPGSLQALYSCPSCLNRDIPGHGIPGYRVPSRTSPLRVSLSRSEDWCLVAACLDDGVAGVGVDLEAESSAGLDGVQSVAMTENEREKLRHVAPALRPALMTRLWVRKEAVLKALGTGLARDPARVDVAGPIPRLFDEPPLQGRWQLEDLDPSTVGLPDEFTAACAIRILPGPEPK